MQFFEVVKDVRVGASRWVHHEKRMLFKTRTVQLLGFALEQYAPLGLGHELPYIALSPQCTVHSSPLAFFGIQSEACRTKLQLRSLKQTRKAQRW